MARAHLQLWLEHGHREQVLLQFEKLKVDPRANLGFNFTGTILRDPHDTASVQMLSVVDLRRMHAQLDSIVPPPEGTFDSVVARTYRGGKPGRFAHIQVDLAATKTQLLEDFYAWLHGYTKGEQVARVGSATRVYDEQLVRRWVAGKFLPYADLRIFALASGRVIDRWLIQRLLGLGVARDRPRDALRAQVRALKKVFCLETAVALHLAAGSIGKKVEGAGRAARPRAT